MKLKEKIKQTILEAGIVIAIFGVIALVWYFTVNVNNI